jgi:hypothetical protein
MLPPVDLDAWAHGQGFPDLHNVASKQTSDFDLDYNCIAHAFLDDQKPWWPTGLPVAGFDRYGYYWPIASDNRSHMRAFLDWFSHDGWTETKSDKFAPHMLRVALYAKAAQPTHAARQIGQGVWTSKLGQGLDLSHKLEELNGPNYGAPIALFEKKA